MPLLLTPSFFYGGHFPPKSNDDLFYDATIGRIEYLAASGVCTDTSWMIWTGVLVGLVVLGTILLIITHKVMKINLTEKAIQKFIVPVSESR